MDTLPDIGRNVDMGMEERAEFAIEETNFNDGYVQRRKKGLNPIRRVWSVSWKKLTDTDATTLYNFLLSKAGVEAFIWPHHKLGNVTVRCPDPRRNDETWDGVTVTATFREEFGV